MLPAMFNAGSIRFSAHILITFPPFIFMQQRENDNTHYLSLTYTSIYWHGIVISRKNNNNQTFSK